ncbi:TrmH family RNA methyltransferase [Aquabacterium sp.]|uniref:TrmH family RNA methyltransferase n=1 Tax=Aquabacterium sp. TaxID=1872578 RepID=UPI0037845477
MSTAPQSITSRDNPLLQRLRRLVRDGGAYRKAGEVWLEGEHLCSALRQRGLKPLQALVAESAWQRPVLRELAAWAPRVAVVPDVLFGGISALESPAGIGFVWPFPQAPAIDASAASLVLDRVQDSGNVGSMLRTAAAFGVRQVLALQGTALLWSPKVLRAGMGAHFGLNLVEGLKPGDLETLAVPWIGTSLQAGTWLHEATLPSPCAWLMGHEGQGVDPALLARCALTVRIAQPGGEESLNVAAAAAICLHESMRQAAPKVQ